MRASTSTFATTSSWDLGRLAEEHEKFIEKILEEEDEFIVAHKAQIDAVTEISKNVICGVRVGVGGAEGCE